MIFSDEVAMVRQHIHLGAKHIAEQRARIAHFRGLGVDTTLSEQLLANFEDSQSLHLQHLSRLQRG